MFDAVEPAKREPSTYEAMVRAFMTVEDRDSAMKVVNEALSRSYPAAVANKILELTTSNWTTVKQIRVVQVKHEVKARLTHSSSGAPGGEGPRTHTQVLANSVVASVLILLHAYKLPRERKSQGEQCWPRGSDVLVVGIVANYAAVAADTFSSELGILSSSPPRLLTSPTLRRVPPGTNGGVTATGLAAGLLGSFLIAATSVLLLPFCGPSPRLARLSFTGTASGYDNAGWDLQSKLSFVLGVTALGFCGSVLDSLLGGLLQASVTDTRTGRIIEGDGGKKVLVSGAGSMHQKQVAKVRRSHEEVEVVGAAARKGGQEGRRVESGWDVLSNNGVNLVMACTMSLAGMVAASWIWGLSRGEMLA
ncbi:hypothetical protein B0A49_09441 [Cryomyces minteri]|uniref:Transmembrane protein 19 n=1 Tax=Cryomyces minteri TaxID=331657 RepID=A0A4U0WQW8_9PEZI|nr:hypothetical protein B0A49_09441 [Cryomyces minteri]